MGLPFQDRCRPLIESSVVAGKINTQGQKRVPSTSLRISVQVSAAIRLNLNGAPEDLRLQWTSMIRNLIVPRVLGNTQEELQPALELLRAMGATPGHEWHEGGAHGFQLEAPSGAVELIL